MKGGQIKVHKIVLQLFKVLKMVPMKVNSHKKVLKGVPEKFSKKEILKKSPKKVLKSAKNRVPKKVQEKVQKEGLKKVQIKVMSLFQVLKEVPKKVLFLRKVQKRAL